MATFALQLKEFADLSKKALLAVHRGATQEVADRVRIPVGKGGRIRVDTGFLRASLMGSTAAMPPIDPTARPPADAQPNSFAPNNQQISLAIASATLDETFYLGFTAAYAQYRENLDLYVETVALSWPAIVDVEVTIVRKNLGL